MEAMDAEQDNVSAAARRLGISRFTLTRKLRSYGLGTRVQRHQAREVTP